MASRVLILAKSGNGKTASIRNFDPETSVIIQIMEKDLPFPGNSSWKKWEKIDDKIGKGSRIHLNKAADIQAFMTKAAASGKKTIIIDDLVYMMADKVMAEKDNKDWDKWTDLADEVYKLIKYSKFLPDDVNIYFMTHPEEDSNGNIKMKTAGKLLDNLITPEGMFTIVLGAEFKDGKYWFKTTKDRNSEIYKSPMGLFDNTLEPNDLYEIDKSIRKYNDQTLIKGIENGK